jgi:hypothetical protein
MRHPLNTLLLVGLLAGQAGVARAQSPPAADPVAEAKARFREGSAYFARGKWERAIEAFQKGYLLAPEPLFLFNIAQSYRRAGDVAQARAYYQRYLDTGEEGPEREESRRWLDALAPLPLVPTLPPAGPPSEPPRRVPLVPPPAPHAPPPAHSWGTWAIVAGIGVVVAAAAVVGIVVLTDDGVPDTDLGNYPAFR